MVFTLQAEVTGQDGKVVDRTTKVFVAGDLHSVLDRVSEFLRASGYPVGYLTDADEPSEQDDPAFESPNAAPPSA